MLLYKGGAQFSSGRSTYSDHDVDATEGTAKIFVSIEPEGFEAPILAQLDTGSAWSVLHVEIAEALGLLDGQGEAIVLQTRHGPVPGRLENTTLTILAEAGDSLAIEATVFVSRDWPGRTFLGYSGLLERIRFALDPQAPNHFYFGSY